MKKLFAFLSFTILISCQITETINLNEDGTGNIEIYSLRDENSFMQMRNVQFASEKFKDTTFVFQDYIKKYQETFVKFNKSDQALFFENANVKMHIKVDPYQMENFNVVSFNFKKLDQIPDLYASIGLANSLKENYPIQKRFFKIKYNFDGNTFKRNMIIIDQEKFDKEKKVLEERKRIYSKYKTVQSYTLNYHFSRKIKSVSNSKAIIKPDGKSLTLEFVLSDCIENPESTDLEVILE